MGHLFYDADLSTAGGAELILTITEFSGGVESDNNLTSANVDQVFEEIQLPLG